MYYRITFKHSNTYPEKVKTEIRVKGVWKEVKKNVVFKREI